MNTDAQAIAERLDAVDPASATPEEIALGERAIDALSGQEGSPVWQELCLKLGSFYLELPSGDKSENVDRAIALYGAVLAHEPSFDASVAAANGLGNAAQVHPDPDHEFYELTLQLMKPLLDLLEDDDDVARFASLLGTYAAVLWKRPYGDRNDGLARALAAQKRAVDALSQSRSLTGSLQMGRALHMLGGLHLEQPGGVKSDHVDAAVKAFFQALEIRTTVADPIGRARTLRTLALALPQWTGAESVGQAESLAEQAREEADWITTHVAAAAARSEGWSAFSGQKSALTVDLDFLESWDGSDVASYLDAAVANHRAALDAIPRQGMPVDWSSWMGGLGRLLAAYYLYLGRRDTVEGAYASFQAASEQLDPDRHARLWRDVHRRLGELAHADEDWERSHAAHVAALSVSDTLYEATALPEARALELRETRGFGLLGAYAAARAGQREEAVRLAELSRSRSLVDALVADEIAFEATSPDVREEVAAARDRILALEARVRAEGADPLAELRGLLADYIGVNADLLGVRKLDRLNAETAAAEEARREVSDLLHAAHAELRDATQRALAEAPSVRPLTLSAADVGDIAAAAGYPIIYLLPSMHGCMFLSVAPGGPIRTLQITGFTSDQLRVLLHGNDQFPGYARGAYFGDRTALAEALPACVDLLAGLLDPVTNWLAQLGYDRAALVPLGSLGALPLHAAAVGGSCAYRQVPNARVLARALEARQRATSNQLSLFAVANPPREDLPPLPFAAAEAAAIASLFETAGVQAEVVRDAERDVVLAKGAGASHLHLACHALFRPSDPMASSVSVSSSAQLMLGDLVASGVDLSGVSLVVLSACQTALKDMDLLDESIGFPSGLLVAGVPGVVSTTWAVRDELAAVFCYRLYGALLAGSDAATATQATQSWLRSVTGRELVDVIRELRRSLGPDDIDADSRLDDLMLECELRLEEPAFPAPEDWAAFTYHGV